MLTQKHKGFGVRSHMLPVGRADYYGRWAGIPGVTSTLRVAPARTPRTFYGPRARLFMMGLGATVSQCEDWRQIAAGYNYGAHTDTERRRAAQGFNTECRDTAASTARGAAEVIAAGGGSREASSVLTEGQSASQDAQRYLQTHSPPVCSVDYSIYAGRIQPAQCGPLDGACIKCSADILRFNMAHAANQRSRCRREGCRYDCARNTAAGHPERCRACDAQNPIKSVSPPACVSQYSAGYVSPAATVASSGKIVVDDSGASFYTLLPAGEQTPDMSMRASTGGGGAPAGDGGRAPAGDGGRAPAGDGGRAPAGDGGGIVDALSDWFGAFGGKGESATPPAGGDGAAAPGGSFLSGCAFNLGGVCVPYWALLAVAGGGLLMSRGR